MVPILDAFCIKYLGHHPHWVDARSAAQMPIRYSNPAEVGADRIVNAVAAFDRCRCGLIVVDFGTATTFDVISAEGEYQGGAIAPGIGISADALFDRASKLPRVEFSRPTQIIAKNTVNSIQAGIFFGYVGLVEGMVARFRQELGPEMKVIATGGLAEIIAQETDVIQFVDPWITLKGLRLVYEMNE